MNVLTYSHTQDTLTYAYIYTYMFLHEHILTHSQTGTCSDIPLKQICSQLP